MKAMSSGDHDVHAEIDQGTCEGHALCLVYAPEIFDMDPNERAFVTQDPVPASLRASAEEAATQCPVQAIRLHRDGN
jgi:ferredoxin